MKNEELVELIQRGEDVSDNMGRLYSQNEKLIRRFISQYVNTRNEIEDLMQEAYFILEKAVKSYNPERGTFSNWMVNYIKYLMPKQIEQLESVKIPISLRQDYYRYRSLCSEYEMRSGHTPSDQEIINDLGISLKELKQLKKLDKIYNASSLDSSLSEYEEIPLVNTIADKTDAYAEIDDSIDNKIVSDIIENALSILTEKQGAVIRCRMQGKTTRAMCNELGYKSLQAVSRVELSGLSRINKYIRDRGLYEMLYEDAYRGTLARYRHSLTGSPEQIAIRHLSSENAE